MGIVVNRHTCVRISLLCPYMISFCWSHNKHGWIMLGCTCCEVSTLCANHSHQECWMNTFCTQTLSHFGYSWLTMTFNLVHIVFQNSLSKKMNKQLYYILIIWSNATHGVDNVLMLARACHYRYFSAIQVCPCQNKKERKEISLSWVSELAVHCNAWVKLACIFILRKIITFLWNWDMDAGSEIHVYFDAQEKMLATKPGMFTNVHV